VLVVTLGGTVSHGDFVTLKSGTVVWRLRAR
jgi:hypothetical protein